jgi:hypothetical protein
MRSRVRDAELWVKEIFSDRGIEAPQCWGELTGIDECWQKLTCRVNIIIVRGLIDMGHMIHYR